jgi:hypothetical protein
VVVAALTQSDPYLLQAAGHAAGLAKLPEALPQPLLQVALVMIAGGTLKISSTPERGTIVSAQFPLPATHTTPKG